MNTNQTPNSRRLVVGIMITSILLLISLLIITYLTFRTQIDNIFTGDKTTEIQTSVSTFTTDEDFKNYISEGSNLSSSYLSRNAVSEALPTATDDSTGAASDTEEASTPEVTRVSETNVQVTGIDEPDIVKTDGNKIYYSGEDIYYLYDDVVPTPMMEEKQAEGTSSSSGTEPSDSAVSPDSIYPQPQDQTTKIIQAFPPEDLEELYEIKENGNMLLSEATLIIINQNSSEPEVIGYEINGLNGKPTKSWSIKLSDNTSYSDARLLGNTLYLITSTSVNSETPCPMTPVTREGTDVTVKCSNVYHPYNLISVDSVTNIFKINPQSGQIEDQISFVSGTGWTQTYMSLENIYLSYQQNVDFVAFFLNFSKQNTDIIPNWFISKLDALQDYDISQAAKQTEMIVLLEKLVAGSDNDERIRLQTEISNRLGEYMNEHLRETDVTAIVKIRTSDLDVAATGSVPGHVKDQFSFDEYNGNLRIATTVGSNFSPYYFSPTSVETLNDVYILNSRLGKSGELLDLGKGETIQAVRFIEDKGYVVTFKQIDPFFVIDLSKPENPKLAGELKIPGFSSYLHPIDKDTIIGIGQEDWKVKVSLFDVSDPANPEEVSKMVLDEYYTDIQNTHHAFLIDRLHEIMFIPASNNAYILSYSDSKLTIEKVESNITAKRALYINEFLYIISDTEIKVLNETNWKDAGELEL